MSSKLLIEANAIFVLEKSSFLASAVTMAPYQRSLQAAHPSDEPLTTKLTGLIANFSNNVKQVC
tara:strand:+ start:2380 stop:2571 length:192 start_codon:yes stop_codon:yes gene_type:complete